MVPYTRGAEISRPVEQIVAEVAGLAEAGVREVTLIGQNVNAYHGEGEDGAPSSLGKLLHRLSRVPGIARLRYTTSHPRDMDDDLVRAHAALEKVMPYVHLPVQSGANRILAAMNRKHTRKDYLDAVARLRAGRRDLAFTSDFIVGFPGETEQDFRDTLSLVDDVGYASAFSFMYSSRPGTPAADMDDQVPHEEKAERLQRLQASITRHQRAFNASFAGRELDVLLEKPGKLPGQLVGKSPYLQAVQVMAPASLTGEVVRVTVTEVGRNSLFGTLSSPPTGEERSSAGPLQGRVEESTGA